MGLIVSCLQTLFDFVDFRGMIQNFILAIVFFVVVFRRPILYIIKWLFHPCYIEFDRSSKGDAIVGQTVTFKIKKIQSRLIRVDMQHVNRNLFLDIRPIFFTDDDTLSNITFVKEFVGDTEEIVVKFSVRKVGDYHVKVIYNGFSVFGAPFTLNFTPAEVDASNTVLLNPHVAVVADSQEAFCFIHLKDKFGNIWKEVCNSNSSPMEHFEFQTAYADDQNFAENIIGSSHISHLFIWKNFCGHLELVFSVNTPGLYKGRIFFKGKEIKHGTFNILCVTSQEKQEINVIKGKNPGWHGHNAGLSVLGNKTQVKNRKVTLYVSPKLLYVQEYVFKIIPFKIAVFRVSPVTKFKILYARCDKTNEYIFSIMDGIHSNVTLVMAPSKARIMLGMYFSFLKEKMGGATLFEDKQRLFYNDLKSSFDTDRITIKQISVQRGNLVASSMSATKYFWRSDWCKNFGVQFVGEFGYDLGGLRKEWLEVLCQRLFQNEQKSMFASLGNSRLVHPNSQQKRDSHLSIKYYEFAGKIVGKCLFESSVGGIYSQMVNARFSRSFLAQVLGLPPNYMHLEQDDPELYISKVKYILQNDVKDLQITFSEEVYDEKNRLINTADLIPGGSKIPVTNENKEQYLNALAIYRLRTNVIKEIDAFRKGLFYIVPEELFSSFDENELELLMCGRSKFDVQDLKTHCVQDWLVGRAFPKVCSWFFNTVSNLSDDERGRLLQFVTGSSQLPHGGFAQLSPKFRISFGNEFGKLPCAHTCFNQLVVYDCDSFESFERNLRTAINEGSEGFSFA